VVQKVFGLWSFAGQNVAVEFRTTNRQDWSYNTWTYLDSVRVINQPTAVFRTFLPVIQSGYDMKRQLPAIQLSAPANGAGLRGGR
jgi:hypothetical protein